MSITAKTTLCVTTQTAKNNAFYGNATTTTTTTKECVMDKFDNVNCPNTGIAIEFEYRDTLDRFPSKYKIKANKYAITDGVDGVFRVWIANDNYYFVLSLETDEHNNIDLDMVYVNLYYVGDEGTLAKKIKIEDAILTVEDSTMEEYDDMEYSVFFHDVI